MEIYGQGPTAIAAGMHAEGKRALFAGEDVRYTLAGATLYATTLGTPSNVLRLQDLNGAQSKAVSLSGYDGAVEWSQTAKFPAVKHPATAPVSAAHVLKIEGNF